MFLPILDGRNHWILFFMTQRSGLSLLRAEAKRLTCLRKPLDGRPALVAPRMTDPDGAECAVLPRRSSLVLCLGSAKWALAKLGWAVFLLGWIPPFSSIHHESPTSSAERSEAEGTLPLISFTISAHSPSPSNLKVSSLFSVLMTSSDSNPSTPAVDPAAVCFAEMYRQDPSLRPDGLMGGIDHSRVLSAVPLRTSITVASSYRAPPLKKKKKKSKVVQGKNPKSLPITVLETGPITNTGCLLLDVDFDEALRFVGDGYVVRRPHTTNHVFSVTCPDAEVGVHVASMRYGLRFPPHDLIVQFLNFYRLLPGQLSPHSYYCFSIFLIKCHQRGVLWSLDLFRYMFKNIAEVGILISLDRQFELSEAVLGSHPKYGLEESAPRSEDLESEDNEEEDDGEAETNEELGQPSYSEGVAGMEPSGGDMNPVDVIRKAKLLARNRGRGAEVQQGPSTADATGSVASAPNREVSAKLSLISERRAGAEFSSSVNFLASVETELSRLRKLAETEHEQAVELEMQAVAKSEELDVELAEAVSSRQSLEAERDRSLAERDQAVAEKERAIFDFIQSPSFKEACMEKMAAYYEDWLGTEAGTEKMGVEETKWFESGVYHGIQLVLCRTRRVDPSFPPPGVDIPEMHDTNLNAELGENPDYLGTPEREDTVHLFIPCVNLSMASNNSREIGPLPSQQKTIRRRPPPPPEDAESRTSSRWYRAKKLEKRIKCLRRLVNYLHGVPQQAASLVEPAQPAADAIPVGDNHPEESVGSS
ncbi:unnamed protein product [Cuscuta campestris]|uniref:Transposase (putative) gypsy type domain-containing protein n=1 Tax=Cuscuta campestris TaxID=132261 RepID=A0A484LHS2_9ASTE|nr:unnamed protein product [Cuscuta campestris]